MKQILIIIPDFHLLQNSVDLYHISRLISSYKVSCCLIDNSKVVHSYLWTFYFPLAHGFHVQPAVYRNANQSINGNAFRPVNKENRKAWIAMPEENFQINTRNRYLSLISLMMKLLKLKLLLRCHKSIIGDTMITYNKSWYGTVGTTEQSWGGHVLMRNLRGNEWQNWPAKTHSQQKYHSFCGYREKSERMNCKWEVHVFYSKPCDLGERGELPFWFICKEPVLEMWGGERKAAEFPMHSVSDCRIPKP